MKPNQKIVVCQVCGKEFSLPFSQAIKRKTCSKGCMAEQKREAMTGNLLAAGHRPNATTFRSGMTPWNKDKKGIHLSPQTQFKKGQKGVTSQPVGSVTIRKDKNGCDRAWVKVAEPNKWKLRAVLTWETKCGPVPKGCVIHHHDRNSLNDSIDNLRCMTRRAHIEEHRHELQYGNNC